MSEQNPTVMITGASRGLGRALLEEYVSRKWTVFPVIRDPQAAEALQNKYAPICHPVVGDVTDSRIETTIAHVLADLPALDILINNAGITYKERGLERATAEDLSEHFNVHCVGALRCTKAALPYLRKAVRPIIINITSRWGSIGRTVAGQGGLSGGLIYSYKIAKCAQNMLTACLDHELRPSGIRVYAVHPGRLQTAVAPADADTTAQQAARQLYKWLKTVDDDFPCCCYDLFGDSTIEW